MSQKIKNNLSIITQINNKLSVMGNEKARDLLSQINVVTDYKTVGYICDKLDTMTDKEARSVLNFLVEQYADVEVEEVSPFTELDQQII